MLFVLGLVSVGDGGNVHTSIGWEFGNFDFFETTLYFSDVDSMHSVTIVHWIPIPGIQPRWCCASTLTTNCYASGMDLIDYLVFVHPLCSIFVVPDASSCFVVRYLIS